MTKGLKDEVKCVVNSLLVPHPNGLVFEKFLKEYFQCESNPLPYKQLGYNTPLALLQSMPDVVKCVYLPSGHIILRAVGNENISHIQEMVQGQRNKKVPNSASFRVINKILRTNQPTFNRHVPPPLPSSYRNSSTGNFSTTKPHFKSYRTPGMNGTPVTEIDHPSKEVMAPARTCSSIEQECQLVSEFQKLFQAYPDGVDVSHVFGLYGNKFRKPVLLHNIDPKLTSAMFFQRHPETFRLWKKDGITMVALKDPHQDHAGEAPDPVDSCLVQFNKINLTEAESQTSSPPQESVAIQKTGSPSRQLGAIPKNTSPFHRSSQYAPQLTNAPSSLTNGPPPFTNGPPPLTSGPPPLTNGPPPLKDFMRQPPPLTGNSYQHVTPKPITKTQWVSTDIRTRGPGVPNLQRVTVAWDSSGSRSTSKITSVEWRAPSFADNDLPPTFGITRPKIPNVYQPETKMTRQQFPPDADTFEYFFIIVAEVYSPGEFYWFISENRKAIETLTDNMTYFYEVHEEHKVTRKELYVGQFVAAMYSDALWYRARIVGCHGDDFEVFFLDYGSRLFVKIDRLRHLDLHFTQMPIQAFRGRIFGVRPLPHETKWSVEAGQSFLKLIKGSKVMAAAKMAEEMLPEPVNEIDTVYSLTLVDTTQGEKDIHINDYLIENGFAIPNDEELQKLNVMGRDVGEPLEGTPLPFPTNSAVSTPMDFPTSPELLIRQQEDQLSPSAMLTEKTLVPKLNGTLESHAVASRISTTPAPTSVSPFGQEEQQLSASSAFNHRHLVAQTNGYGKSCDALTITSEPSALIEHHSPKPERSCVKRIVLEDQRQLFIVEDDRELYLPRFDMLMLVPSLECQMESLNMKTDVKLVNSKKHANIFSDCVKAGAPWIKENGELLSELTLYELTHVTPLLFLFGVKDKIATSAIEAELRRFNEQFCHN